MHIIHQGFDGLDVSFKARIPRTAYDLLEAVQIKAQEAQSPLMAMLGGLRILVRERGSRGGYSLSCDTGDMGASWWFKKPDAKDLWGIRVSMKSLPLALNGIPGARRHMDQVLLAIGLDPAHVEESIGRVDWCADMLTIGFVLEPEHMVMHSRMKAGTNRTTTDMEDYAVSGRTTGVRVGKMPGRQITVYDKRLDVIEKGKTEWWPIWNANLRRDGLPPIHADSEDDRQIWRCEARFGKRFLVNPKRCVKTFDDLEQAIGLLLARAIAEIRLTVPNGDSNAARWSHHPLWRAFGEAAHSQVPSLADEDLTEQVTDVIRAQRREQAEAQVTGLSTTLAALWGLESDDPERIADAVAHIIRTRATDDAQAYQDKLKRSRDRYAVAEQLAEKGVAA